MQRYIDLLKLPASDRREFDKIQGDKNLSTRGAVKVLQVGRTIADLEGKEEMTIDHILQAMGFMGLYLAMGYRLSGLLAEQQ